MAPASSQGPNAFIALSQSGHPRPCAKNTITPITAPETAQEEGSNAHSLAPAAVVGVCEHEAHQEEEELHAEVAVSADLGHGRDITSLPAVRFGNVEQRHEKSGGAAERVGDDVSLSRLRVHAGILAIRTSPVNTPPP